MTIMIGVIMLSENLKMNLKKFTQSRPTAKTNVRLATLDSVQYSEFKNEVLNNGGGKWKWWRN